MTLFDSPKPCGVIKAIGCDEATHRRLVDMGLLDAKYRVKARRRGAVLVDYGGFSAVTRKELAESIEVSD